MARCSLLLVALVGACYAPAIDDGLPCSETLACPGDQVCDTSAAPPVCRRPGAAVDGGGDGGAIDAVDGSPSRDADSDGIFDADDNCPAIANPDQRDRDNDQRGDRCDDCPTISDPGQVDGEGDGIGDACDPWPTLRDRVLVFDDLDAALTAPWDTDAGALYQDGLLIPQPTEAFASWSARYPVPASSERVAMELGAQTGAAATSVQYPSIKVFIDGVFNGDGTTTDLECGVVHPLGQGRELSLDAVDHDVYTNLGTAPVATTTSARLVLARAATPSGGDVRCAATVAATPAVVVHTTSLGGGPTVGLFLDHFRASIDYVVIYTSAP